MDANGRSRLESVSELIGAILVPLGLICGIVFKQAHPHHGLWRVLALCLLAMGTPLICISVLFRWRRWFARRR